jgi:hypothetical protein
MTTLFKQFEQAKLPIQNFSKLHGMLKIGHQNPINAIKQKKIMQYQSIMIQKLFMNDIFTYLNCIFLLTLFKSFDCNLICFRIFYARFWGTIKFFSNKNTRGFFHGCSNSKHITFFFFRLRIRHINNSCICLGSKIQSVKIGHK